MLQRPSSLKQMNLKMECFSSLLVTVNTEVTELKFNLKLTNLCRLDEWQLSGTIAPLKSVSAIEMPKSYRIRRIMLTKCFLKQTMYAKK